MATFGADMRPETPAVEIKKSAIEVKPEQMVVVGEERVGFWPYFWLLLAIYCWCFNYVFLKYALQVIPAIPMVIFRTVFSTPVMLVFAWLIDGKEALFSVTRQQCWQLLLIGVMNMAVSCLMFNIGMTISTASDAALFQPLGTVFAAIFAVYLGREKAGWMKMAGVSSGVVGALLVVLSAYFAPSTSSSSDLNSISAARRVLGMCCYLGNTFFFAVYITIQQPILSFIPPVTVSALSFLFTSPFLLLLGIPWFISIPWNDISGFQWPLNVAIVSAIVFEEKLTAFHFVGGTIIIGGVGLVIWARNQERMERRRAAMQNAIVPDSSSTSLSSSSSSLSSSLPSIPSPSTIVSLPSFVDVDCTHIDNTHTEGTRPSSPFSASSYSADSCSPSAASPSSFAMTEMSPLSPFDSKISIVQINVHNKNVEPLPTNANLLHANATRSDV